MTDVNISLECAECHHSRGVLYYANPLAWGRPCRRCRKMMSRSVVVVPTQVQTTPAQVAMPVQGTTTTTTTTSVPIRVTTY
ncbi:hypothetical protein KR038_012127 [Drosophila bunnanda]|nr:hypothetical protein KR038_012127 [Drosophila bunnanda]